MAQKAPSSKKKDLKSSSAQARKSFVPSWMRCTWLRIPCGGVRCPVCSLLHDERAKLVAGGESDDVILDVLDDLRYSVAEAFLNILDEQKAGRSGRLHKRLARGAASPRRFKEYAQLDDWHESLHETFDDAQAQASFWVETTDAADLDWYTHVALDYLHRHLLTTTVSRGAASHELTSSEQYVRGVLLESAQRVEGCLARICLLDSSEKGRLILLLGKLSILKKSIDVL